MHSLFSTVSIVESWIELSAAATMAGVKSPDRITPLPFANGEEYLRLLREAQRESNQSSRVVSLASSRRDTPRDRYDVFYILIVIVCRCFNVFFVLLLFTVRNHHRTAQIQSYAPMRNSKMYI